jgi:membrane protein implicated in regulation of membrane protease activity
LKYAFFAATKISFLPDTFSAKETAMGGWWESLTILEKVLWLIAVPSSVLTVLQVILEVMGFGGDSDAEVDMDAGADSDTGDHGSDMHIFTVKGLIIFFTSFAWVGLAGLNSGLHVLLATALAVVTGTAFMLLFAWVFYTLHKFTEEGTVQIKNALFQKGEVYLVVPAARSAPGKVTVKVQGHLRELTALTDGEAIPTGARIQVVDIIDEETVLVAAD